MADELSMDVENHPEGLSIEDDKLVKIIGLGVVNKRGRNVINPITNKDAMSKASANLTVEVGSRLTQLQEDLGLDYPDTITLAYVLTETSVTALVRNSGYLPARMIEAARASIAGNGEQNNGIKATGDQLDSICITMIEQGLTAKQADDLIKNLSGSTSSAHGTFAMLRPLRLVDSSQGQASDGPTQTPQTTSSSTILHLILQPSSNIHRPRLHIFSLERNAGWDFAAA